MNPEAAWDIKLNVDCPICGEHVNLLDDPDFWDGRDGQQVGEHRENENVICPKCLAEFVADFVY